jgi:hypothetical protein
MTVESTGYRFLETEPEVPSDETSEFACSVEFNPSLDDYVYATSRLNKSRSTFTPWTKFTLQAFYLINAIGLPAALLFFGYSILAIGVFALNIFLATFFLPASVKFDYRRYYRSVYGDNFEREIVQVELTHEGVHSRHGGNASFHLWKSICSIEETSESIYLYLRGSAVIVRKSGFPFDEQKKRFLSFAMARLKESQARQLQQ